MSLNLGAVPDNQDAPQQLRSVPTDKILDELLRRDCVDFSQAALHMRLAPFYLFLVGLIIVQLGRIMHRNPLECFWS